MEKKCILVVDDEQDICDILRFNLETEGYSVATALSAEEAEEMILSHDDGTYALLLLDVMLGGMSGFALARQLQDSPSTKEIPIIFITAKSEENDTLTGLNLGADDYIAKPFSVREVLARVRAVLRRSERATEEPAGNEICCRELSVNTSTKTVTVAGQTVRLTRTEYDLLVLLLTERQYVFSRQELLRRVWRDDVIVTDRTVDVNITRLRKKLGAYGTIIKTRQGFGYYLDC